MNARGSGYALERRFTKFGKITQNKRPLRRSRSFKVTDFCTNRKLICEFLFVINTKLILTYILSCNVSKLWRIIVKIFAIDRGYFTLTLSLG